MSCNRRTVPKFTDEQIAECQGCKHASGSKKWCCLFGVWIGQQSRIVTPLKKIIIPSRKKRPCSGCGSRAKKALRKSKNIVTGYNNLIRGKEGELAAKRTQICLQCADKRFISRTLWCSICKCFIPAKARVPGEKCPKGKW